MNPATESLPTLALFPGGSTPEPGASITWSSHGGGRVSLRYTGKPRPWEIEEVTAEGVRSVSTAPDLEQAAWIALTLRFAQVRRLGVLARATESPIDSLATLGAAMRAELTR